MTGHVDSQGRALLEVRLRPLSGGHPVDVAVWIDTAFTGELVLPRSLITSLALPISSAVRAVLADGSEIDVDTYTVQVDWFTESRSVEVIAKDGQTPLLGVGLLLGRRLHIDYAIRVLTLD